MSSIKVVEDLVSSLNNCLKNKIVTQKLLLMSEYEMKYLTFEQQVERSVIRILGDEREV